MKPQPTTSDVRDVYAGAYCLVYFGVAACVHAASVLGSKTPSYHSRPDTQTMGALVTPVMDAGVNAAVGFFQVLVLMFFGLVLIAEVAAAIVFMLGKPTGRVLCAILSCLEMLLALFLLVNAPEVSTFVCGLDAVFAAAALGLAVWRMQPGRP